MRKRHPRRRISLRRVRLLPDVARLAQVAFVLRVTRSTVRNWMRSGLRAERDAEHWHIRAVDVERYLRTTRRLIG